MNAKLDFAAFLDRRLGDDEQAAALRTTLLAVVAGSLKIHDKIRLGALAGVLGEAGSDNVQGEAQKKMDVIADELLIDVLKHTPTVAGMASEEDEHFLPGNPDGVHLLLFDPLDGSSNIDVNISVGTIFSILPAPVPGSLKEEHFLRPGREQLAAGYILYGVQTQLVLTWGAGVFAFTLDDRRRFILTRENITVPRETAEFAINMSNRRHWEPPVRAYIDELLAGKEGGRGKDYNMRWVASMVAEVHRILSRGGVFMYPRDRRNPDRPGKLRLMYEANPMSFIITQAGGRAVDARENILDIRPSALHQRVAVFLGAGEEIDIILAKHAGS